MDGINEPIEYVTIKIKSTVCTMDSVTIPILSYQPISLTTSNDSMICQDLNQTSSAQLNVYPHNGIPPYQYSWQPTSFLSNPNIANPVTIPPIGNSNYYIVSVTDSTGCPGDTSGIMITVNEAPVISFDYFPFPAFGCAPVEVTFTDQTTPLLLNRTWEFGDGNTSQDSVATHTYNIMGSYTVKLKVETPEGCKSEASLFDIVKVYPNPVASFTASNLIVPISNALIYFNSTSSSSFVTGWNWDFGDPNSNENASTIQNPSHGFNNNGLYTITLIVSTAYNCKDTTSLSVRIVEDSLVFPNIITPNGDGHNDYFDIPNLENYVNNQLSIFNRWGKKIYFKEPYIPDVDKWDANGLPDGTYFYILKYQGYLKEGEQKGSITVLR